MTEPELIEIQKKIKRVKSLVSPAMSIFGFDIDETLKKLPDIIKTAMAEKINVKLEKNEVQSIGSIYFKGGELFFSILVFARRKFEGQWYNVLSRYVEVNTGEKEVLLSALYENLLEKFNILDQPKLKKR